MTCPSGSEIVYSPFRRLSQADYFACTGKTDNSCWWQIIILLSSADEARKQQFAATSLVMGLVPLTLKDIAWPERRVVLVSRPLRKPVEVVIRALGLVPSVKPAICEGSWTVASTNLYQKARSILHRSPMLLVAICIFGLLLSYAAIAVVEVYSKRSCLGCPYPVFILTWHLLAIIPATVDTALSRSSERMDVIEAPSRSAASAADTRVESNAQFKRKTGTSAGQASIEETTGRDSHDHSPRPTNRKSRSSAEQRQSIPLEDISPVQGRGKMWLIQLVWAIYYIAGTLVYTSIVAVTVIELVVWVAASIAATAASKLLGFFICANIEMKLGIDGSR